MPSSSLVVAWKRRSVAWQRARSATSSASAGSYGSPATMRSRCEVMAAAYPVASSAGARAHRR